MPSSQIPSRLADFVRNRANERCEYCLIPQASQEATFHIDHITPRAKKGRTVAENLALACVTCSLRKAARTRAFDPSTGSLVSLFHPRRQEWHEHFMWTTSHRVKGKTPIGRATIVALGMNRAAIVAIRRRLAALGGWPR